MILPITRQEIARDIAALQAIGTSRLEIARTLWLPYSYVFNVCRARESIKNMRHCASGLVNGY
jgi:hypothetical protein